MAPAADSMLWDSVYNRAEGRNPPAHWFETLRDAPREGMVRPEILGLAAASLKD